MVEAASWKGEVRALTKSAAENEIKEKVKSDIKEKTKALVQGVIQLQSFTHDAALVAQDMYFMCRACRFGDKGSQESKDCYNAQKIIWEGRHGEEIPTPSLPTYENMQKLYPI